MHNPFDVHLFCNNFVMFASICIFVDRFLSGDYNKALIIIFVPLPLVTGPLCDCVKTSGYHRTIQVVSILTIKKV